MPRQLWTGILLVVVCLIALPTLAAAQSQFTGQVKDESGGVLPGVTVEAASPALLTGCGFVRSRAFTCPLTMFLDLTLFRGRRKAA